MSSETISLLQAMIRNACVNEGTEESGQEARNASTLIDFFAGSGVAIETYDAAPGRKPQITACVQKHAADWAYGCDRWIQ